MGLLWSRGAAGVREWIGKIIILNKVPLVKRKKKCPLRKLMPFSNGPTRMLSKYVICKREPQETRGADMIGAIVYLADHPKSGPGKISHLELGLK